MNALHGLVHKVVEVVVDNEHYGIEEKPVGRPISPVSTSASFTGNELTVPPY